MSNQKSTLTANKSRERIRWACRRGMLECDLFLVPFFESQYDSLSDTERQNFEALLQESDADLIIWLMGEGTSDNPAFEAMIQMIRRHKRG